MLAGPSADLRKTWVSANSWWASSARRREARVLLAGLVLGLLIFAAVGWTSSYLEQRTSEVVTVTQVFQYDSSRVCVRRSSGEEECGNFVGASSEISTSLLEVGQELRVHREETTVDGTDLLLFYGLHQGTE